MKCLLATLILISGCAADNVSENWRYVKIHELNLDRDIKLVEGLEVDS